MNTDGMARIFAASKEAPTALRRAEVFAHRSQAKVRAMNPVLSYSRVRIRVNPCSSASCFLKLCQKSTNLRICTSEGLEQDI
jgi:hypothetical protein